MSKPLRFGDEGTQVTTRETVVAVLFTIGIVALLVVRGALGSDDGPAAVTTRPAAAPPVARSASSADPAAPGIAQAIATAGEDLPVARVPASAAAAR